MDAPIAVVGAGPVGLMLAGELRLGGAGVVVLEKRSRPATESRASTLHARTMEILASRRLREAFGEVPCEPRGHFGGIPLDLGLPGPFPGQWKVPQTRTEAVLGEWATGLGATVLRRWTVTGVSDAGDHVRVVADTPQGARTVTVAYLVACDGQDGVVRELIGAAMSGRAARRQLLRADVRGVDVPNRRFERLPRGMAVAARNPAGVTRVMVHEHGRAVAANPGFAEVVAAWRRVTGEDLSGGEPIWVNAFDDADHQLDRYRHGRVLFAGDAAHVQMPVGGQALNLGLQDAVNLGWKLAAVVRGDAPAALLDTYQDERHRVGRQVLANIRAQAEILLGDTAVDPVRALLAEMLGHEHNRALAAGVISGVGLRYPAGPDDHPAVGARIPGADPADGRGVLIADGDAGIISAAGPWRDRVGLVRAEPPLPGVDAVLVRPDGHVAWAGTDPATLTAALTRWFGRPVTSAGVRKEGS